MVVNVASVCRQDGLRRDTGMNWFQKFWNEPVAWTAKKRNEKVINVLFMVMVSLKILIKVQYDYRNSSY